MGNFKIFDDEDDEQPKPLSTAVVQEQTPSNEYQQSPSKGYSFKEKLRKKYLLTIESKMNMDGFLSSSTVEIRWQLVLKKLADDEFTFELITLDHTMIKADNSGFMEMHKLVAQLQKALNEIIFTIDKKGNLLRIDNLAEIKRRWQVVKGEVLEYNHEMASLQDIFAIQDEVFESRVGVEGMVKATEFFDIYLNQLYGRKYPFATTVERPNLFRTADIPFLLGYSDRRLNSFGFELTIDGRYSGLSSAELKKAYGHFPFIEADTLQPAYGYNAKYIIDAATGFLHSGEVHYTEAVSDKLGGEVHFKFSTYE